MSSKTRKPLFERLKAGLEEGIAHARGELNLRTITIPDAPPPMDAREVLALRGSLGMSQAVFAAVLNVAPKTIQSWEQGNRIPSLAARRLIQILARDPESVCRIVGIQIPQPEAPPSPGTVATLPKTLHPKLQLSKARMIRMGMKVPGVTRKKLNISTKKPQSSE